MICTRSEAEAEPAAATEPEQATEKELELESELSLTAPKNEILVPKSSNSNFESSNFFAKMEGSQPYALKNDYGADPMHRKFDMGQFLVKCAK